LKVDIPCPGHAPLIIGELQKIGVSGVKFSFPNLFDMSFDSSNVSKEQILGLEIFKTYKASVVGGDVFTSSSVGNAVPSAGCGCGGGSGGCGGNSCNINLNSLK
jgi:hypothetical protein